MRSRAGFTAPPGMRSRRCPDRNGPGGKGAGESARVHSPTPGPKRERARCRLPLLHLLSTADLRMRHTRWTRAAFLVHQHRATLLTDVTITSGSRHADLHSQNLRDNDGASGLHQVTRKPMSTISRAKIRLQVHQPSDRHRGNRPSMTARRPVARAAERFQPTRMAPGLGRAASATAGRSVLGRSAGCERRADPAGSPAVRRRRRTDRSPACR